MRPGDVSFRTLTCSASPAGTRVRRESRHRARKLNSFTLMLVGGVLLWGAVTGLAKQKRPQLKTVSGVVMDEKENLIQGAMVEMKDIQTGKVLDIYSQEGGQYQFTDLRFDHDYTVQATYKDDASEVRQVSSIDMRAHPVLNLTILKTNK